MYQGEITHVHGVYKISENITAYGGKFFKTSFDMVIVNKVYFTYVTRIFSRTLCLEYGCILPKLRVQ